MGRYKYMLGLSKRLQGKSWYVMRDDLEIFAYRETSNGNICVYVTHKATKKPHYHWLSKEERKVFNKDDYPIFEYYMVYPVEPYQRKTLLDYGYTDEVIDKMSKVDAGLIIARIELKEIKERQEHSEQKNNY